MYKYIIFMGWILMKLQNIYDKSPIFFQNIMCTLYGYKENRKRFNKFFYKSLLALKSIEYLDKKSIDEYKKNRLGKTLLVSKKNPLYVDTLSNYSEENIKLNPYMVLEEMPILSKSDLINFDMNQVVRRNSHIYHTSGTTGKALAICKDDESIMMQWAIWLRHRARFDVELGDLSVNFTGKPIVPEKQIKPPYWRFNKAQNQYLISSKHINKDNIKSIVSFLNSIKPVFYSGYPSIISEISRLAILQGLELKPDSRPRVVFSGAENLLDYQQDNISSWIDSPITDQYGLTEGNCNFSKCEYGYYHEDFEFCHLELIDTEELKDGSVRGRLIGTAFYNKALPLIRYDTGDIAIQAADSFNCECGRKSQVILSVEGRKDDYLVTPDGRRVMRFGYLFRDTFEALEVQIIQEKPSEVVFRAVLSGQGSIESFEKKVTELFEQYISNNMILKFDYVESIARSSNGKFKAVLNRMG